MRGHVFLTTLFALTLAGGAAFAETSQKDHADRARPQKERVVRERDVRAPMPERMQRVRTHGDVERVARGAYGHKSNASEKTHSQLTQRAHGMVTAKRNCSEIGNECVSKHARDSSVSHQVDPSNRSGSWLSREREKLREQYLRGLMAAYMNKALKTVGK